MAVLIFIVRPYLSDNAELCWKTIVLEFFGSDRHVQYISGSLTVFLHCQLPKCRQPTWFEDRQVGKTGTASPIRSCCWLLVGVKLFEGQRDRMYWLERSLTDKESQRAILLTMEVSFGGLLWEVSTKWTGLSTDCSRIVTTLMLLRLILFGLVSLLIYLYILFYPPFPNCQRQHPASDYIDYSLPPCSCLPFTEKQIQLAQFLF